jgi:hypothetical protein
MPLSSIVIVVLRLFAIQMVGTSLHVALSFAAASAKERSHPPDYWIAYLAPLGLLVFATCALVTRSHLDELAAGVTR